MVIFIFKVIRFTYIHYYRDSSIEGEYCVYENIYSFREITMEGGRAPSHNHNTKFSLTQTGELIFI